MVSCCAYLCCDPSSVQKANEGGCKQLASVTTANVVKGDECRFEPKGRCSVHLGNPVSSECEKWFAIWLVHISHMSNIRPRESWTDINKQKKFRRGETYFKIMF
jgi:hypothetical protein